MNDSASKRSVKTAETGLAFDYSWADPSKNRWVYPRRMLEADDLKGARFLEFDVRTVQNKPENDFFCCNVFLLRSDGRREQLSWDQPSMAWETRFWVMLSRRASVTRRSRSVAIRRERRLTCSCGISAHWCAETGERSEDDR